MENVHKVKLVLQVTISTDSRKVNSLILVLLTTHFGPRVYPMGSIVIALVRPSVGQSVLKYLRDRSLVFLKLCIKLGVSKEKK